MSSTQIVDAREITIPGGGRLVVIHIHAATLEDYERIAREARRDSSSEERYLNTEYSGAFRRIKYADQDVEFICFDPTVYPSEPAA